MTKHNGSALFLDRVHQPQYEWNHIAAAVDLDMERSSRLRHILTLEVMIWIILYIIMKMMEEKVFFEKRNILPTQTLLLPQTEGGRGNHPHQLHRNITLQDPNHGGGSQRVMTPLLIDHLFGGQGPSQGHEQVVIQIIPEVQLLNYIRKNWDA